jgi:hypothetical protein
MVVAVKSYHSRHFNFLLKGTQMYNQGTQMYTRSDLEIVATVRRPVQCEGIDRGPKRMAEVAASGSVNPQFDWSSLVPVATGILGGLGI